MKPLTPPRFIRCALLALGLGLLAPVSTSATTPIYKCFDQHLGLLYTDEPCKDGERLNIRAGDADPTAVARLERVRDALDQSAAQRIADERRAATQRDLAGWYAGPGERGGYDYLGANMPYDYDYGGAFWWAPGFSNHHPLRSRPPKGAAARHAGFKSFQMGSRR